jgi:hypothetical protein
VSNEQLKRGVTVSPFGGRSIWRRLDLVTMTHRLKAIEAKMAQGTLHPRRKPARRAREDQGRKRRARRVRNRMSWALRRQDTFYAGAPKGAGRVYRQTFIDTQEKASFARLHDRKTPIMAASLLNGRVVPFHEANGVVPERVLTDRGTVYCGTRDRHEYELYLAVENIAHPLAGAFLKKIYAATGELKKNLDVWMMEYNEASLHLGRYCLPRRRCKLSLTPAPSIAQEKQIGGPSPLNWRHEHQPAGSRRPSDQIETCTPD